MGLENRPEICLREAEDVMRERRRQAETAHLVREARLAQPARWRSALAAGLRAAAARLEPRPAPRKHTL